MFHYFNNTILNSGWYGGWLDSKWYLCSFINGWCGEYRRSIGPENKRIIRGTQIRSNLSEGVLYKGTVFIRSICRCHHNKNIYSNIDKKYSYNSSKFWKKKWFHNSKSKKLKIHLFTNNFVAAIIKNQIWLSVYMNENRER